MSLANFLRLVGGLALWGLIVLWSYQIVVSGVIQDSDPVNKIEHHFREDHLRVVVHIPRLDHRKEPKIADPIKCSLHPEDPTLLTQIGEVQEVEHRSDGSYKVTLLIWVEYKDLVTVDTNFAVFGGPTGFGEIMSTLFDSYAKKEAEKRWAAFLAKNGDAVKRIFSPILESTMDELVSLLLPNIEASFNAHQDELWTLLREHWKEDVKGFLLPLLKEKANPRINREIIPLFMDCVQELWEKAPAGSFAWNAFRDKIVPWDTKDNLRKRFVKWLDDEGKDVIDAHLPGVMNKCEEIGEDLLQDQEVRDALASLAQNIFTHPQFKALGQKIVQEAILDNPNISTFLEEKLNSPEVQKALGKLGKMIDPFARDLIDSIILDPRSPTIKRINPTLVKILRAQILWKKDFWLLMEPGTENKAMNDWIFPPTAIRYGFD